MLASLSSNHPFSSIQMFLTFSRERAQIYYVSYARNDTMSLCSATFYSVFVFVYMLFVTLFVFFVTCEGKKTAN